MKIKQLKWTKKWADIKKYFWYENQFEFPFEYCVEQRLIEPNATWWSLWLTDASGMFGGDRKIGDYPTSEVAKKFAQKHFEKTMAKYVE